MCSKVSLLFVALCALAATPTESQAPGPVVVLGQTCATPCGVTNDIKEDFADNLLLFPNINNPFSRRLSIFLSEVFRGNRSTAAHRSAAAIIGLDGSTNLASDFNVFIAWVETQRDIEITDGLLAIVDGRASGLDNMLAALKRVTGRHRVNSRAMGYFLITWLGAYRTSYSADPQDTGDLDTFADAKFEAALVIPEAIVMYRSMKYFESGNVRVGRYLTDNRNNNNQRSSESSESESD